MPAMISHYLIGCRVLERQDIPKTMDRDWFLLGTQGPDIFYFSRAYPWLPGKKGMPIGTALHEARPSVLVEALRKAVETAPPKDRRIAESYTLGFLCHYAADRTMHPYVCAVQDRMIAEDPTYAVDRNPYHYRIESAIDTILLRHERQQRVERFALTHLIPKADTHAEAAVATLLCRVIGDALGQEADGRLLLKLRSDMRHSMWWMTDRFGVKHKAFRVMETALHKDPWYSSLVRTPRVDWYDFANCSHESWREGETADVFELFQKTVSLTAHVIGLWFDGADGMTITQDVDFSGNPYTEKEC